MSMGFCDVKYNADGQLPGDEEGGSKQTTTIIVFVVSFVLVLALGSIIYCKCKKAPDVTDSTPIGENMAPKHTDINPDRTLSSAIDRTISQDQNMALLTADRKSVV